MRESPNRKIRKSSLYPLVNGSRRSRTSLEARQDDERNFLG